MWTMPRRKPDPAPGPPLPPVAMGAPEPHVIQVDGRTYVDVAQLRRVVHYRTKRAHDNGVVIALLWMKCLLDDMLEDNT